jgi:hypothetical protein
MERQVVVLMNHRPRPTREACCLPVPLIQCSAKVNNRHHEMLLVIHIYPISANKTQSLSKDDEVRAKGHGAYVMHITP